MRSAWKATPPVQRRARHPPRRPLAADRAGQLRARDRCRRRARRCRARLRRHVADPRHQPEPLGLRDEHLRARRAARRRRRRALRRTRPPARTTGRRGTPSDDADRRPLRPPRRAAARGRAGGRAGAPLEPGRAEPPARRPPQHAAGPARPRRTPAPDDVARPSTGATRCWTSPSSGCSAISASSRPASSSTRWRRCNHCSAASTSTAVLASLVDKSLVVRELDASSYRLLETIRAFAVERLDDAASATPRSSTTGDGPSRSAPSTSRLDRWMSGRLAARQRADAEHVRQAFWSSLAAGHARRRRRAGHHPLVPVAQRSRLRRRPPLARRPRRPRPRAPDRRPGSRCCAPTSPRATATSCHDRRRPARPPGSPRSRRRGRGAGAAVPDAAAPARPGRRRSGARRRARDLTRRTALEPARARSPSSPTPAGPRSPTSAGRSPSSSTGAAPTATSGSS